MPERVIVMGAGPAGLACAHALSEDGREVTVLERRGRVGGLSATYERDGFRFDLGGHRWFTKNPDLHAWFLKLMEGQLVEVDRTSRILFDGKYFDYPIRVGNVVREAGLLTCALSLWDYGLERLRGLFAGEPRTVEEAFVRQFGRRLYEMFFRRYTEKVWGQPCDQMSADWVAQRSSGLSLWSALVEALGLTKGNRSTLDRFVYPRLGYQEISEQMAREVTALGNEVRLEAEVREVELRGDGVVVRYLENGDLKEVEGEVCVSTLPLPLLLKHGLTPKPPAEVIEAAESLRFRSLVCVNLMLDRPQLTTDTWLYCHDESVGFGRLHEPKNWSPAMAPEGKTGVCLEYFCWHGDEVWERSEEDLVAMAARDLAGLGLLEESEVSGGFCVRAKNAYPVYDLGYGERMATIQQHLSGLERLIVVGRGGSFRYNNADHSIEMGLLAGHAIAEKVERNRILEVNQEQAYCEADIVPTPVGAAERV